MAYEKKDGSGALFKNDKTGGNPNWPDYKGDIMIDGVEYWLSAWLKEGKKGKFMSLAANPKDKKTVKPANSKGSIMDMEDNIPF